MGWDEAVVETEQKEKIEMGNKFLGKGRGRLFSLALTALLTVLTGAGAYAENPITNGGEFEASAGTSAEDVTTAAGATTGTVQAEAGASVIQSLDIVTGDTITLQDDTNNDNALTITNGVTMHGTSALTFLGTAGSDIGNVTLGDIILADTAVATITVNSAGTNSVTASVDVSNDDSITFAGTGSLTLTGGLNAAGTATGTVTNALATGALTSGAAFKVATYNLEGNHVQTAAAATITNLNVVADAQTAADIISSFDNQVHDSNLGTVAVTAYATAGNAGAATLQVDSVLGGELTTVLGGVTITGAKGATADTANDATLTLHPSQDLAGTKTYTVGDVVLSGKAAAVSGQNDQGAAVLALDAGVNDNAATINATTVDTLKVTAGDFGDLVILPQTNDYVTFVVSDDGTDAADTTIEAGATLNISNAAGPNVSSTVTLNDLALSGTLNNNLTIDNMLAGIKSITTSGTGVVDSASALTILKLADTAATDSTTLKGAGLITLGTNGTVIKGSLTASGAGGVTTAKAFDVETYNLETTHTQTGVAADIENLNVVASSTAVAAGIFDNRITGSDLGVVKVTANSSHTAGLSVTSDIGSAVTTALGATTVTGATGKDASLSIDNGTGDEHTVTLSSLTLAGESVTDNAGRAEFRVTSSVGTTDVDVTSLAVTASKTGYIGVADANSELDFGVDTDSGVADVTVGAGSTLEVNVAAGTVDLNDVALSGTLELDNTTVAPTINSIKVDGTAVLSSTVAQAITTQVTDTNTTDSLTLDVTTNALTLTAGASLTGNLTKSGTGTVTTGGTAGISAADITVSAGKLTALGNIAATDDLTLSGGTIALSEDSQTLTVDDDLTVSSASTILSDADADAETLTVTVSGTSTISAALNIDATNANTAELNVALGTVVLKEGGSIVTGATNDVGATTITALSTEYVDGSGATITSTNADDTVVVSGTTTIADDTKLTVSSAQDQDIDLGSVTIAGGTLYINGNGNDDVKLDALGTSTDVATLDGAADGDDVILVAGTKLSLGTDLVYDSAKADILIGGSGATTSDIADGSAGTLLNISDPTKTNITNGGDVDSSKVYGTVAAGNGETVAVSSNSTLVATGATTLAGTGAVTVASGSTYYQQSGAFNAAAGTVTLAGTLNNAAGAASTIADLTATGTSAKILGTGVTVNKLTTATTSDSLTIQGKVTAGANIGNDGTSNTNTGAIVLAGLNENTANSGELDISSTPDLGNELEVAAGKYGLISGAGTATVDTLDIQGHLNVGNGSNLAVDTALNISSSTLEYKNAAAGAYTSTLTINTGAAVNPNDATNGNYVPGTTASRISVLNATGADNTTTMTIANKSAESGNKLGILDVTAAIAQTVTAELDMYDAGTAKSSFGIGTVNLNGTAESAKLEIDNATVGSTFYQDVDIDVLNINSDAAHSTGVVITKGVDVNITAVTFTGIQGYINNNMAYNAASAEASTLKLGTVTVDGSTAAATGSLVNTIAAGTQGTIETLNISGDTSTNAAFVGTFNVTDGGGTADTLTVSTLNLYGANAVGDAIFNATDATNTVNFTTVNIAEGKYGQINEVNAVSNITMTTVNVNGDLDFNTAAAWATAAGDSVNVGAKGNFDITGVAGGYTLTAGSTLSLNLGTATSGTRVAGTNDFAEVTGTTMLAATRTVATTSYDDIYAANGVSGVTYLNVFDANVAGSTDLDTLNTNDKYRFYKLTDSTGAAATMNDIVVSTNTSGINSAVTGNGGTATASTAAQYLISNEVSFDSTGQAYVQAMSNLGEAQFARAAEETIGEEATTQSAQNALMGISASTTAVSNQMTSFRSGNIASGMASSFNSGGATAALSDMADAETLAEAYEAGFTSGSDCAVYKKVQVWANGFGGFGEQGTDGTMIGYDFWNIGTMVGLDYAFAKELRVGALFGYSYNKTDVNWNSGDSTDNLLRFGAYASYNWDNFFVDLSPTMGVHILESNRNIWNGATAKGDRTGVDFNISGTVGYTFNLPADIQLTPSYSLGYTLFYDPEFTETGAGAANVKYNSFTSNSLLQDLGVRLGKLIRTSDDLAFLPEVWGGWEVEYLNTGGTRNTTTTASIGSQTYGTTMNGMATNRAYWGLGLTALIKDNVSVFGRYDQKIWDKGYNVGFTAGVKVGF